MIQNLVTQEQVKDIIVKAFHDEYTIPSIGWLNSAALVSKPLGKNLFNPTLATTTQNGVTFEALGDGTYRLNGTASANTLVYLFQINDASLKGKKYRIVGCPSGGSVSTYRLRISDVSYSDATDYGNGADYTLNGAGITARFEISAGYVCNNLIFKPMIVDANLYPNATYDDYEPFITVTSNNAVNYPKYAKINSDKYDTDFVAQYVDVIPVSGAFFSENENNAREMLNPNVIFNSEGALVFASDTPTVDIKIRIGGIE